MQVCGRSPPQGLSRPVGRRSRSARMPDRASVREFPPRKHDQRWGASAAAKEFADHAYGFPILNERSSASSSSVIQASKSAISSTVSAVRVSSTSATDISPPPSLSKLGPRLSVRMGIARHDSRPMVGGCRPRLFVCPLWVFRVNGFRAWVAGRAIDMPAAVIYGDGWSSGSGGTAGFLVPAIRSVRAAGWISGMHCMVEGD